MILNLQLIRRPCSGSRSMRRSHSPRESSLGSTAFYTNHDVSPRVAAPPHRTLGFFIRLPHPCFTGFVSKSLNRKEASSFPRIGSNNLFSNRASFIIPKSGNSLNSNGNDSSDQTKTPFGYTRKDVLLIGVGVTVIGYGLKSGLEFFGVDPLQAGNVVELIVVLGLTLGWVATYIFRVSNKEMTYAQQLRDYEDKVMQKRLEGLTEAELEALLEQVEEEKRRLENGAS